VKIEKPFTSQHVDGPPPGAGRTLFENSANAENAAFSSGFLDIDGSPKRLPAAERDANLTRHDGETAGRRFSFGSPIREGRE
jgi:hypothetical protein